MDVGDFFEFERALLGDGVINTPAEEQGVVALNKVRRKRFDLGVLRNRRFNSRGDFGDGLFH